MSDNQSPESFVAGLPIAAPVSASGGIDLPLPNTSLLSAAERLRLDNLARTGTLPVEPTAVQSDELSSFSDGSFFKWLPREGSASQCILIDATGQQIAIVKNSNLADFLANAVNLFALAQLKHEAEGTQMQIFHKPILLPEA